MQRYKLLVGLHIGADKTKKPAEVKNADGTVTLKYPSRTYRQGEVVETDDDLLSLNGAGSASPKFELVGSRRAEGRRPSAAPPSGFAAPGGQVAEGHQVTTAGPDGRPVSGPMTEENRPRTAAEKAGEGDGPDGDDDDADDRAGDDLRDMTVAQMRQHAAEQGIALHGATTKKEIKAAIRKARAE